MKDNAINQYQVNSVMTAPPGQLTLMLYNGCLKFIKQAEIALDNNDYQTKNDMIIKAQNIITEFMVTLDPKIELSKNLLPLYEFIRHRLIEANTQNDKDALIDAYENVKELKETWMEVLKMQKTGATT